jgi:N6-L-threonylcarbamoyladenine synthase
VVDVLVEKSRRAARDVGAKGICLGGGVAANALLRERIVDLCEKEGLQAFIPSLAMCTDNAAMIGATAWYRLQAEGPSPLDTPANPNLHLPLL